MNLYEWTALWSAVSIPPSILVGAWLRGRFGTKPPAAPVLPLRPVMEVSEKALPPAPTDLNSYSLYEYLRETDGDFIPTGEWIPAGLDPHLACVNRGLKEGVSYSCRKVGAH